MDALPSTPQPIWCIFTLAWHLFCRSFTKIYPLSLIGASIVVTPFLAWCFLYSVSQSELYAVSRLWIVGITALVIVIYFYLLIYKRMIAFINGERVWLVGMCGSIFSYIWSAYIGLATQMFLIFLGFTLIIPGFYLCVAYAFFFPLLVLQNQRAWPTLKSSLYLVRGHWWRTAAVIVPSLVILLGTAYIFNNFITFGWEQLGAPTDTIVLSMVLLVCASLISSIFFPLYAAIVLVQLQDLQVRALLDEAEE